MIIQCYKRGLADFPLLVWDAGTACVAEPSVSRCRRGSAPVGWESSRSIRHCEQLREAGTTRFVLPKVLGNRGVRGFLGAE